MSSTDVGNFAIIFFKRDAINSVSTVIQKIFLCPFGLRIALLPMLLFCLPDYNQDGSYHPLLKNQSSVLLLLSLGRQRVFAPQMVRLYVDRLPYLILHPLFYKYWHLTEQAAGKCERTCQT